MLNGLVHAHSGLRWILLIVLLYAIWNAFSKKNSGVDYTDGDRKISLYALILTHVQLIIGLALYFMSPKINFALEGFMKNSLHRFFMVEHIALMLVAIILITLGYTKAKKATASQAKFKTTFTYYLIGLILILVSIPWPFRNLGAGWF